jgi:hypothetical protein
MWPLHPCDNRGAREREAGSGERGGGGEGTAGAGQGSPALGPFGARSTSPRPFAASSQHPWGRGPQHLPWFSWHQWVCPCPCPCHQHRHRHQQQHQHQHHRSGELGPWRRQPCPWPWRLLLPWPPAPTGAAPAFAPPPHGSPRHDGPPCTQNTKDTRKRPTPHITHSQRYLKDTHNAIEQRRHSTGPSQVGTVPAMTPAKNRMHGWGGGVWHAMHQTPRRG